jgi:hypothetical protein
MTSRADLSGGGKPNLFRHRCDAVRRYLSEQTVRTQPAVFMFPPEEPPYFVKQRQLGTYGLRRGVYLKLLLHLETRSYSAKPVRTPAGACSILKLARLSGLADVGATRDLHGDTMRAGLLAIPLVH